MLAENWDGRTTVKGWMLSEKLDGIRAWWDHEASELKTRHNTKINTPAGWTNNFPDNMDLDGELFMARHRFQQLMSVFNKGQKMQKCPDQQDWSGIAYYVFDIIPRSDNMGFKKRYEKLVEWCKKCQSGNIELVIHDTCENHEQVHSKLAKIRAQGGEGVMLKDPNGTYELKRCKQMLKFKPFRDAEAVVQSYDEATHALWCNWAHEAEDGFGVYLGHSKYDAGKMPRGTVITYHNYHWDKDGLPILPIFHCVRAEEAAHTRSGT